MRVIRKIYSRFEKRILKREEELGSDTEYKD